jgi:ABC-2 type transport system ATP-binding protein
VPCRDSADRRPSPVADLAHVGKRWGDQVVFDDASATISRGVTGLVGANGAGKTTLLGLLLGLHRADEGSVEVFGVDPVVAGPDVRAHIGYAPEHHRLPGAMRAIDLVRHVAEVHGLPAIQANVRASEMLGFVGLGEERSRPLGTMSTGQRQRVKLAQAIVHGPKLLFLDEPTDGLDPLQRESALALIARVGSGMGIDIVLSSHLLEEVERICDRVVVLGDRGIALSGNLADLEEPDGSVDLVLRSSDGVAARVAAGLADRGCGVTGAGRHLVVSGGDDLATIVPDAVAEAGGSIVQLTPRRRSLEDLVVGRET